MVRLLIQKVKEAEVSVSDQIVGKIGKGLLVFIGIHQTDTVDECVKLKDKLLHLRVFPDEEGKMNLSLLEVKGEVLVVSQFTLYADCTKSRRPSFTQAASPRVAKELYERFIQEVKKSDLRVETGEFGAYMEVSLVNEGPLTFLLDS